MASDATEINRSIFNEEAASYDNKHRKLQNRLQKELLVRLDFIGVDWASEDEDSDENDDEDDTKPKRPVRLLDYACGTGMISRTFAPYMTQCIGMDISENMVEAYNTHAENQGLSPDEMHAIVGDLASETIGDHLSSPDLFNFDLAVVGGGLHHFENPERAVKRLVERLKPGGVLLIWDFLPHAPRHHGHVPHTNEGTSGHGVYSSIMHHGFDETRVREMFTAGGAGREFQFRFIWGGSVSGHGQSTHKNDTSTDEEVKNGDEKDVDEKDLRRQVFFARGTKGSSNI
ncbi:S-adenosyl-L-methionine-dependent methyltransferase [Xylaria intraflava]|nr:S-adenosyl-L-methionine-dependent methyltransferase [Xylaria intraflava]